MRTNYNFSKTQFPENWKLPNDCTGRVFIGGLDKLNNELYYLLDFEKRVINICSVDNSEYRNELKSYLEKHMKIENWPYGDKSYSSIVNAFVQPHEGIELPNGKIAVSLHNTNYIRLIDFDTKEVSQYPEYEKFEPVVLSATNSLSKDKTKYFFAKWSLNDRIKHYENRDSNFLIKIYSVNSNLTTNDVPTIIDSFKGIEGIHEVKCSPNDKYILLTEFCLEGHIHPPSNENINVFEQYDLWDSYEKSGPIITNLRVYEIQKENMIKLIPKGFTPGHVEFSSKNNNIFYLSCHSMLKAYGKVILYGQALLEKYTIKDDWVKSSQAYTSSDFLRITSHEVFTYNNRGFIAVTVYPNYLYIFDEDNFKIRAL